MKSGYKLFFHGLIAGLILLVVWAVWQAAAQSPAAAPAAPATAAATNEAAAPAPVSPLRSAWASKLATPDWVEKLAERYPFLQRTWLGNPIWKYLASLIYIFLAFYVSKLVDFLTRVWLKKWAEKTETKFDDYLLGLLRGPVKVVCFVILLHVGLSVFDWPEAIARFISKGLKVVVAVSLTYMVLKFVDLVMDYWRRRVPAEEPVVDQALVPILRKTLKVFIMVVAALVTAQNLDINITGLVASLGIGGLAVALAAQDTLANFFGAVAIFLDKPFRLGDRIQLDPAVDGVVENIGLRSTRVRNLDGHLITVPNKTIANATITNITRRPHIRTLMNISVTYDTPAERVQRAVDILYEIYRAHPMTQDVWISFNKFADASLNIFIIHWWNGTVYKDYLAGMQELNLAIKRRFDEEKLNFAFPTQTLYVRQDSEWRFAGSPPAAPEACR